MAVTITSKKILELMVFSKHFQFCPTDDVIRAPFRININAEIKRGSISNKLEE